MNKTWAPIAQMTASIVVFSINFSAFAQTRPAADPQQLWTQATLYRDEWGVPHVVAENDRAMAFAFGYAQAEDHLAEMLLAYRVASGRASEVLGEDFVASDEFSIKMGHYDLAHHAIQNADPVTRNLCEGFALGVNSYLATHVDEAPPWAEGIRPEDVLALLHSFLMSAAPYDLPNAYRPPPAYPSANAWAIAPSKSKSGNAILVVNPHAAYDSTFRWCEAHLTTPEMNVAGATLYGLPVILQGHNGAAGWALTPNYPDIADVFADEAPSFAIDPKSMNTELASRVQQAAIAQEIAHARPYYVNTGAAMDERYVTAMRGGRGPVMGRIGDRYLSYTIGGYWDFGALRQFVEMGKASNLGQFRQAMELQQLPSFHVLYADRAGDLFYLYNAKTGVKLTAAEAERLPPGALSEYRWDLPLDGANPILDWGPVVPISALPSLTRPAAGYLQACGTTPWAVTDNPDYATEDWPSWFVHDADTLRAMQLRQYLAVGDLSFTEAQHLVFDTLVPAAMEAIPVLLEAAEGFPAFVQNAHPDLILNLQRVSEWDYRAEPKSSAMTFFHVWWSLLTTRMANPNAGDVEVLATLLQRDPSVYQAALAAAEDASRLIRNAYQSEPPPWGDVHRIRRGNHDEPYPGAGNGGALWVTGDRVYDGGAWPVTYGLDYAMVVEFDSPVRAVSVSAFGASENPESPHYSDQLDLVLQRRFKASPFERIDVERDAAVAVGRNVVLRPPGVDGRFLVRGSAPVEASLTASTRPQTFLPDGLAAYSLFVTAHVQSDAEVVVDFELRVPSALTSDAGLQSAAIYSASPEGGWQPLPEQALVQEERTFRGRDYSANEYVILGPAELLTIDPAFVSAAQVAKRTTAVPKPADYTGPFVSPAERNLSEEIYETAPVENVAAPDEPAEQPAQRPGRRFEFTPITPPPAKDSGEPFGEFKPPTGERQFVFQKMDDAAVETEPSPPSQKDNGPRAVATLGPQLDRNELARRNAEALDVEATLDPATSTPRVFGQELEFRPPSMEGLIRIIAPRKIRAGIDALDTPPVPLPDGLAAFSPFVSIVHMPRGIPATAAMSLRLPDGACAVENYGALALYVFDEDRGWNPLEGFKFNAPTRTFSAIDDRLRTYVIAGPAEFKSD